MLPFEMFLFAKPVSRQARRKKKRDDWRDEIRAEALRVRGPEDVPETGPIRVRIAYCFQGVSLDLDNMLKALLDGLEGVVYTDDNFIVDLIVSKRTADGFVDAGASPAFAVALDTGMDFLHVVVDQPIQVEALR